MHGTYDTDVHKSHEASRKGIIWEYKIIVNTINNSPENLVFRFSHKCTTGLCYGKPRYEAISHYMTVTIWKSLHLIFVKLGIHCCDSAADTPICGRIARSRQGAARPSLRRVCGSLQATAGLQSRSIAAIQLNAVQRLPLGFRALKSDFTRWNNMFNWVM
jgi:hypothetical protein